MRLLVMESVHDPSILWNIHGLSSRPKRHALVVVTRSGEIPAWVRVLRHAGISLLRPQKLRTPVEMTTYGYPEIVNKILRAEGSEVSVC
jgi:hypothetical protein